MAISTLVSLAISCTFSSEGPQPTTTPPLTVTTVATPAGGPGIEVDEDISDFKFRSMTIARGTILRWANQDPFPHTVTSGTPEEPTDIWESGQLATGGDFAYTFGEGRYLRILLHDPPIYEGDGDRSRIV